MYAARCRERKQTAQRQGRGYIYRLIGTDGVTNADPHSAAQHITATNNFPPFIRFSCIFRSRRPLMSLLSFFFLEMLRHLALLICCCASARALLSPALLRYSTQSSRAAKLVHHASLHRSRRLRQSLATGKVRAKGGVEDLQSLAQESAPEILTVDISAFFRNDPAGAF
jgi:hypothetical protein